MIKGCIFGLVLQRISINDVISAWLLECLLLGEQVRNLCNFLLNGSIAASWNTKINAAWINILSNQSNSCCMFIALLNWAVSCWITLSIIWGTIERYDLIKLLWSTWFTVCGLANELLIWELPCWSILLFSEVIAPLLIEFNTLTSLVSVNRESENTLCELSKGIFCSTIGDNISRLPVFRALLREKICVLLL